MKRNDPGSFGKWLTARIIYYPTLVWNLTLGRLLKIRHWWDRIDDQVLLGAVPFPRDVLALSELGVRGVVNTCEEYGGPLDEYRLHGIEQFHMPTIDFTHPADDDVGRAVAFIDRHIANGDSVYIHCKAGRGRSATVAICWLMKAKKISAAEAQAWLTARRPHVNQHLPERPVVQRFESSVRPNVVNPTQSGS